MGSAVRTRHRPPVSVARPSPANLMRHSSGRILRLGGACMRTVGQIHNAFYLCAALSMVAACGSDGSREHRWYPYGKPRHEDWHSPIAILGKYDSQPNGAVTRPEVRLPCSFDT